MPTSPTTQKVVVELEEAEAKRLLQSARTSRPAPDFNEQKWIDAHDSGIAKLEAALSAQEEVQEDKRCGGSGKFYSEARRSSGHPDGPYSPCGGCPDCQQVQERPGEDCPFCDYAGPSGILMDYGDCIVFDPIAPVVLGHVLVVPKAHVPHLTANAELTAAVFRRAAEWAREVGDCNLIVSKGAHATQTVEHLHVHVVPRREGDELALPWSQHHSPALTRERAVDQLLDLAKLADDDGMRQQLEDLAARFSLPPEDWKPARSALTQQDRERLREFFDKVAQLDVRALCSIGLTRRNIADLRDLSKRLCSGGEADKALANLRPASRAHLALEAAVLQCIETGVWPKTIRRFVEEALPEKDRSLLSEGVGEDGASLILAERQRQVEQEGWSPEHDDEHTGCEMALAAMVYADPRPNAAGFDPKSPELWPWERDWYKPRDYVSNLVKAGALIAAEIDRVRREESRSSDLTQQPAQEGEGENFSGSGEGPSPREGGGGSHAGAALLHPSEPESDSSVSSVESTSRDGGTRHRDLIRRCQPGPGDLLDFEAVQWTAGELPLAFLRDGEEIQRIPGSRSIEVQRAGAITVAIVRLGDWLIRKANGRFYTMDGAGFQATYEPATTSTEESGQGDLEGLVRRLSDEEMQELAAAAARQAAPVFAAEGWQWKCGEGLEIPSEDEIRRTIVGLVRDAQGRITSGSGWICTGRFYVSVDVEDGQEVGSVLLMLDMNNGEKIASTQPQHVPLERLKERLVSDEAKQAAYEDGGDASVYTELDEDYLRLITDAAVEGAARVAFAAFPDTEDANRG